MLGLFRKKQQPRPPEVLADLLTLDEAFEGVAIIGGTGSGKTTGPGAEAALNLLAQGAGFCVLCCKPDEYSRWARYCYLTGRSGDLVRFAPGTEAACDLLGCELSHADASVEAAAQLLDIIVQVSSRNNGGRGEEPFSALFSAKIFRRAIGAVWLGKGTCSLRDIHRLLVSAPTSFDQMNSKPWQKSSFCWEVLEQGKLKYPPNSNGDFDLCGSFWLNEWPSLSDKTRSVGYAMATNILDKFLGCANWTHGVGRKNNRRPRGCASGQGRRAGHAGPSLARAGAVFPGRFQDARAAGRPAARSGQNPRPVVIFGDEAQFFFVPEVDVLTQTVARQSRLISVVLSQNLPMLYSSSGGGEKARQEVDGWLSCHMTKIALANTCVTTGAYFSNLFGSSYEDVFGGTCGTGEGYSVVDDIVGRHMQGGPTINWSAQWKPDVPAEAFTRLPKPCPPNYLAIGYVFQGGKIYQHGKPWAKVAFRQTF